MLHIFDWFASKAGAGFPMVGWPPTYDFFRNPPSKPMPPMVRTPHLKMSPAPHLKNTPPPHWNVKQPSMKWFLKKAQ